MEFDNASQAACYDRVAGHLSDRYAGHYWTSPQRPFFVLTRGSALATIDVRAWGEQSVVRTWSLVVTDIKPTPELYEHLLRLNAQLEFGAFALDADNDVVLSHTIVGDWLDAEELQISVEAVAQAADDYDDQLVEHFGGRRAEDRQQDGHGATA